MRVVIVCLVAAVVLSDTPCGAQCGTPGSTGIPGLAATSDLWDSSTELVLSNARPGADWVLLVDFVPGPTPTPFGPVCIGPSPIIVADSITGGVPRADAAGRASLPSSIPPAASVLIGLPFYFQGVVVDPLAQGNIALTNGLTFVIRSPRVFVSLAGGTGELRVLDGQPATTGAAPPVLASIPGERQFDFAVSRDGDRVYLRRTFGANTVRCWDVSGTAPALLGTLTAGAPISGGEAQRSIVLTGDDRTGYFVDSSGGATRFDADPASATFMQATGTMSTTLLYTNSLALLADDSVVAVTGIPLTPAPGELFFFDAATLAPLGSILLTEPNPLSVVGAPRHAMAVSPDGRYLASLAEGLNFGLGGLDGGAILNIVDADPGSATFLQEIATVPLPGFGQLQCTFAPNDPGSSTVYTVDADVTGNLFLTAVDWTTGTVSSVPLGSSASTTFDEGGVATTPSGSFIFVATRGDATLRVFDSGLTQVNAIPLGAPGSPATVRVERR